MTGGEESGEGLASRESNARTYPRYLPMIVDPNTPADVSGAHPPDPELATAIQRACFDRGLVVERGRREGATVRFLPPLVVSESEVDEITERFDAAVAGVVDA